MRHHCAKACHNALSLHQPSENKLTWYVRDKRPRRPLLAGPLASAMARSSSCPPGRATCRGREGRAAFRPKLPPASYNEGVLCIDALGPACCVGYRGLQWQAVLHASPHLLRGLVQVQREAQQRGGVVQVGVCHRRTDQEAVGAAVQFVHLQWPAAHRRGAYKPDR